MTNIVFIREILYTVLNTEIRLPRIVSFRIVS